MCDTALIFLYIYLRSINISVIIICIYYCNTCYRSFILSSGKLKCNTYVNSYASNVFSVWKFLVLSSLFFTLFWNVFCLQIYSNIVCDLKYKINYKILLIPQLYKHTKTMGCQDVSLFTSDSWTQSIMCLFRLLSR